MMRIFQTFSMAMKSIFNNKMRSLLTMLGIIIGVCSVITLVSVMRGSQAKIMESYALMGTNRISVYYNTWDGTDFAGDLYKFCQSLKAEVEGVTPSSTAWLTLRYKNKSMDSRVNFGSDQFDQDVYKRQGLLRSEFAFGDAADGTDIVVRFIFEASLVDVSTDRADIVFLLSLIHILSTLKASWC